MKAGDSIHQRVRHYAHTEINELYQDLHISKDGYDEEQVENSCQQYGSNLLLGRA